MADPEHLAIIKKGVDTWNEWRQKNPGIEADLSDANLSKADLRGANLSKADLIGVYLHGAKLTGARLTGARLSEANLSRAHLSKVNLGGAFLNGTKLSDADLIGADLHRADLSEANLSGACLIGADLHRANLCAAHLFVTDLSGADLGEAKLIRADLSGAKLVGTHLEDTDARYCRLCQCDLTEAMLTGARLYATARDDWIINGIDCAYVFWDCEGVLRSPKDKDFAPGEFEQIYKTLPTIEYVFQNGMTPMDPLIMDRVVQAIREQNPEYDVKVDSINARGLAPSIKFTVLLEEYKEAALAHVRDLYEVKLRQVEAERDRYWAAIARALDAPREVKLIAAAPGSIVAADGSTINIDQHVEYITSLRDTVAALPEGSPTFAKVAKKTALDIIGGALKDVAKGQVKKAAEQIIELGKDLGPVIVNTAAYGFFKSCLGL